MDPLDQNLNDATNALTRALKQIDKLDNYKRYRVAFHLMSAIQCVSRALVEIYPDSLFFRQKIKLIDKTLKSLIEKHDNK